MADSVKNITGEEQAKRLELVYARLQALLRQSDVKSRLNKPPEENAWSIQQILGHLVEMIPYWLSQCRILVNTDSQPLPVFGRTHDAPERLEGIARGAATDLEVLLSVLERQIQAAARAIRQISIEERVKKGLHTRFGEITVGEVVEKFIVSHAEEHLVQVEAILQI